VDNLLVGQVVLEILEHLLLALNFLDALPKWLKISVIVFTIRLIYLDNCLLIKSCKLPRLAFCDGWVDYLAALNSNIAVYGGGLVE
jgi:hypothetical protein